MKWRHPEWADNTPIPETVAQAVAEGDPTRTRTERPVGLTDAEHEAMDLTASLYNLMADKVVGRDHTRQGDMTELAAHVHAIQNMLMAQAAARAHPSTYRLLGGTVHRNTSPYDHDGWPIEMPCPECGQAIMGDDEIAMWKQKIALGELLIEILASAASDCYVSFGEYLRIDGRWVLTAAQRALIEPLIRQA